MSSVQTGHETPTELRLDYNELVDGRLVIVIHGLPTANHDSYGPVAGLSPSRPSTGPTYGRRTGHPSSPLIEEAAAIGESTGYTPALFAPLLLAAWRGREALVLDLVAAMIEAATAEDIGRASVLSDYAKAVLYNGLGRYHDAAVAAQRVCGELDIGCLAWAHLELVEACARGGARADATGALRDLSEQPPSSDPNWALGVRARSAALLSDGNVADALYREAIERFDRGLIAVHLARTQLVYGEWLRRESRRVDAREQLRAAYEIFSGLAAEAFAERTRRELMATGETARRRTDDTRGALTPQEAQIARLARDGLSNPEIGEQLFISPRTVQYHLRKVFVKLNITSRNQLGRVPPGHLNCLAATRASELQAARDETRGESSLTPAGTGVD